MIGVRAFIVPLIAIGVTTAAACSSPESNVRVWQTVDGEPDPPRLIQMWRGAEHCGWQNTWFLETRNPGDTTLDPVTLEPAQFVLNLDSAIPRELLNTGYELDVDLPDDARFTGYVSEGSELWVSQAQLEIAVFLVSDDHVERLPRARSEIYCD